MGKFFGTDGIRGKAEMFTSDFLERIVRGLNVQGKRVLIGGDTRKSTKHILENLKESLTNCGAHEVGVIGVFPTPGIYHVMTTLLYDYAIDVTASHNPYTDNGIKIFEFDELGGQKLGAEGRARIEAELADDSPLEISFSKEETSLFDETARGREYYTKHLKEYLGEVSFEGLRIALDCANGATGVIGGSVFEELGASVDVNNNDTEFGRKINDGVGSTHIEGLQELVRKGDYDFGAAFDGDGDRCILVDKEGRIVDGDQIIAILAEYLKLDKVVATVAANQGLMNWGKRQGVNVLTSSVGDQNVAREMKAKGARLGGEQSGHIILPGEAMGDGMMTALMIAKVITKTGRSLSELASTLAKTPQVTVNVPATRSQKIWLECEAAKKLVAAYEKSLTEEHGRVLVRPSGTEELIRITVWGDNTEQIKALAADLAEKIRKGSENGDN